MQSNQSNVPETNTTQRNVNYLSDISTMTVDEIIMRYQNNTELLYYALVAKADEDKRRAAEEWHQAENARAQSMYLEHEINQIKDCHISSNSSMCSSNTNPTTNTDADDVNIDQYISPLLSDSQQLLNNDQSFNQTLALLSSDFYLSHQSQQEEGYTNNSSSPPCSSVSSNQYDISTNLSSSPPDIELYDLLQSFSPSSYTYQTTTQPPIPYSPSSSTSSARIGKKSNSKPSGNTAIIKLKSGRSIVHRTLSYESVMNLKEYNTKIMNELNSKNNEEHYKRQNSSPSEPLDHNKVMEALRAKLKKSSSHHRKTQSSPETSSSSESPPPPPPPPNVHPTTGVLLLDLKNRKRKSSVTKRTPSGSKSRSNSIP